MSASFSRTLQSRVAKVEARGKKRKRRGPIAWVILGILILLGFLILVPFLLMLLNAFKTESDYALNGPLALPSSVDFTDIIRYITTINFGQKLINSVVLSTSVAVLSVLLSLFSAYALGIGRVKGRVWILGVVLVANILPQEALIYPLFSGVQALDASDSLLPVIVILAVLQASFGTYLLASVMGTFPRALVEAAQIDGASRWRVLWQVVFPLVRPTLAVVFIFAFIGAWNEFLIPILFLTSSDSQTLPIALAGLQGERFLNPTMTAAGSLLSMLPTFVLFLIFQKTLVRGITVGSIK
jgi:raffinose/stachyose/melibiose transport system permease protein